MKILLIVDLQKDFCPGGSLAVNEGDKIVPTVNALIESGEYDVVIASKDWHPENHISFAENHKGKKKFEVLELDNGVMQVLWPTHCVQNSKGSELRDDLLTEKIDYVINKGEDPNVDSYSAFFDNNKERETELNELIIQLAKSQGITNTKDISISVCGLALDYCVAFTAIDAKELGYDVELIVDATRAVESKNEVSTFRDLSSRGINLVDSSEVLSRSNRSRDLGQINFDLSP